MNVIPFPQKFSSNRGFRSFKCREPIVYTRRCCRDALIQATLDVDVTALFAAPSPAPVPGDAFFSFGVELAGKRCLVALCDESCGETFRPDGFELGLSLNRATILSDPQAFTARMVWSCRDLLVPPLFLVRALKRLAGSSMGVQLGDLEDELVEEPTKWVDYIFALACRGLVTIDCRRQLTPRTIVRTGPVALDSNPI